MSLEFLPERGCKRAPRFRALMVTLQRLWIVRPQFLSLDLRENPERSESCWDQQVLLTTAVSLMMCMFAEVRQKTEAICGLRPLETLKKMKKFLLYMEQIFLATTTKNAPLTRAAH